MAYIQWLDAGNLQRDQVGGKGASLSHLIDAGFTMPDGFCVTADAYRHFAEATGIQDKVASSLDVDLSDRAALQDASKQIEALVAGAELPEDLASEVVAGYEALKQRLGEYCAVRS